MYSRGRGISRMKKSSAYAAVFATALFALICGTPAYATPTTVDFTILNGLTDVATGSLQYTSGGTITSFSGFTAFSITFDQTPTVTYTQTQLDLIPTADTYVDFNTSTNQFQWNPWAAFYGVDTLL